MEFNQYYSTKFDRRRVISSLITIPILIYLVIGIAAYFLADKMIFQPQINASRDDRSTIRLKVADGELISARWYDNPDARFTILFSHGNAEDIFVSNSYLERLSNLGFNVLAYDYRGYGTSDGRPSEAKTYEDAEASYNYLTNELMIDPKQIILHGRSLGGAVAIDLARRKPCGGLIVESSFVTAFRVLTRYRLFPFDEFRSIDKIRQVNCPVLFIHGRKDEVVPLWHGEELFTNARSPKYSHWVENAGHNDVAATGGAAYFGSIKDFAGRLTNNEKDAPVPR